MNPETRDRLFGFQHAFDHPVVTGAVVLVVAGVVLTAGAGILLSRLGRSGSRQSADVMTQAWSWLWPALLTLLPAGNGCSPTY